LSLLTLVQRAALRIGLTPPSVVYNSTEQNVKELLECAQEEGEELMRRGTWQVLRKQQTFTAVAQEVQTSAVPSDFDRFINETFWNRTRKIPFWGPVTPQEWQTLLAWNASPVTNTFTFRGNDILITPNPTAGDTMAFEYISKNWCQSSGGTAQSAWAADTDTGILDEKLMRLGVIWRYKQKKGFNFSADLENYETQVKQALTKDMPMQTVSFGDTQMPGRFPGIAVPQGSWSVS